jgi:hypothetical protein
MTDDPQTPFDKPARKNNPTYHVFRLTSGDPPVSPTTTPRWARWEQLTKEPIRAASRKMAVEVALTREPSAPAAGPDHKLAEEKARQKGPFLVVPEKECWIKSRTTKTETTEVWS